MTTTDPRWVSLRDAAEHVDVSEKTMRRWIAAGTVSAKRFGPRVIRVDLTAIERAGRPLQYVGGDAA